MKCRNENQRPWNFRRKIVVSGLLFDAFVITVCLFKEMPEAVATTSIASAFASASALIGSYVFGAVWSDKK